MGKFLGYFNPSNCDVLKEQPISGDPDFIAAEVAPVLKLRQNVARARAYIVQNLMFVPPVCPPQPPFVPCRAWYTGDHSPTNIPTIRRLRTISASFYSAFQHTDSLKILLNIFAVACGGRKGQVFVEC